MILTIYVFNKRKIILILSIPGFPTRSVWLAKSRFPTVTPSRVRPRVNHTAKSILRKLLARIFSTRIFSFSRIYVLRIFSLTSLNLFNAPLI
ncbi:unnamed protein product [Acanthoscelides obtectus]|uniref:Uncharacterized protein n=1 Tax=Acanthoscelides obtectus TaxID=200917 RepID=A0A9P0JMY6_ACAOB|nr:unnamed protein product [Acanthoscelides obtectus]CAK1639788.1 hypothetical protein AOBTE_LOCUS11374 [Acanthoscelides obtectus]